MGRRIYYGLSDGHAIIMTSAEAWRNVGREWMPVHPAEVGENFHEISKAQFDSYDLPDLPLPASIHDTRPRPAPASVPTKALKSFPSFLKALRIRP